MILILGASAAVAQPAVDAEAERVLQAMSGALAASERLSADVEFRVVTQAEGLSMVTSSTYQIAVARPAKAAILGKTGAYSSTFVTDGTTETKLNQMRYEATVGEAPPYGETMLAGVTGGIDSWNPEPLVLLATLLREKPYEALIGGVTSATLGKSETVDGRTLQQVVLAGRIVEFDLWVPTSGDFFPVKATANLAKFYVGSTKNPKQKALTAQATIVFNNWRTGAAVPDDVFSYQLPSDVTASAPGEESGEGGSDLLGRPAPAFNAKLLTGEEVDVLSLKGKVVVLDFWASWCGPCREGLPVISKLTAPLKEKGVEFLAVNVREERAEIEKFLASTKLTVPVLLDPDGKISDDYGVSGIPQTVLIGKDGSVQVVHVGFGPGTEAQMRGELDDLLAGKVLATTATTPRKPRPAKPQDETEEADRETTAIEKPKIPDTKTSAGLTQAWAAPGIWMAVAALPDGQVFASDQKGQVIAFDKSGKPRLAFNLGQPVSTMRSFVGDAGKPGLLAYQGGGRHLMAFSLDGTELWTTPVSDGIADVRVANLDGKTGDEILITTKNDPAVLALDGAGKQLWKADNVKRPTAAAAAIVDKKMQVLASAGDGKLYIADAEATQPQRFDPKVFAEMVRAVPDTSPTLVLVSGTTKDGEGVACVTLDGKRQWIAPVAAATKTSVDAMEVSPDGKYVAAAVRGGGVHVLRVADGQVVATAAEQGLRPEFTWATQAGGTPLLLIAGSGGLAALKLDQP